MNHQPNTPASLNEAVALPAEASDAMCEAAMEAHYGARRVRACGGARGIDMTVDGNGYDGLQAFRRMWRGALRFALAAPGAAIDAREQEPPFITAMIDARRARYALDQSCTPAFLHWLDTIAPREGVAANEAWNAGYAEGLASREGAPPARAQAKWCAHCRKDDHDDAECWSTRMCTCNSYPHTTECGTPTPSEALSPATVAQPVAATDAELGAAAYKGFDDYWTEDSPGKERDAWTASAKAVLKLAQPCASQGCGGAVLPNLVRQLLATCDIDDGTTGLVKEVRAALSTGKSAQ